MSAVPVAAGLRRAATLMLVALTSAAVLSLVLGAGTSDAHKRSVATSIEYGASDVADDGHAIFLGRVRARERRCRAFRRVTMTFVYSDSRERVDSGPTSRNGAFALIGPFDPEPERAIFRTPRKRFGAKGKGHRHVCRAARTAVPIN